MVTHPKGHVRSIRLATNYQECIEQGTNVHRQLIGLKKLVKVRGQDESCVNNLCCVNGTNGITVTDISRAPCGVGLDQII